VVLYVLGTGLTALILLSYVNTSDFFMVAGLFGAFVGIPVLVCSIQFYRAMPKRKRDY
jgi:predicted PurR-regulated permease PerM